MKGSSKKGNVFVLIGSLFVLIGILCNEWTLTALFSPDGVIAFSKRIIIWVFDLIMITTGIVFIRKKSLDMKRFVFSLIIITFMLVAIEIGLHLTFFAIHLGNKEEKIGGHFRYGMQLLSPYKGKEWAKTLFKEFEKQFTYYEPFIGWDRKEYHGKYVNIDSQGVRKSWNPQDFYGKMPDTIYVFGGSTIWGIGARDNYTIPSYISKLLNNDGYNVVVYNYGETAYTFTQEIIQLILLLRDGHRPNYVIFYDGVNDVYAAYQSGIAGTIQNISITRERLKKKEPTNIQHIWIGLTGIFKEYSMIYRSLSKISRKISKKSDLKALEFPEVAARYNDGELQMLSEGVVKYYAKSLKLLENLSKTYNFKYICFWQPVKFTENKLTDEEADTDKRVHDKALGKLYMYTNNYLKTKSYPHFFNISDALSERTKTYYIDYMHLSEEGNEVIATKIVSIFRKEYLLNE